MNLEQAALAELRPAHLMTAQDGELAALWSRLSQWHARACRRQENTEPYERAASYVAQELRARGRGNPSGPLLEQAHKRACLADRVKDLPDVIELTQDAVAISRNTGLAGDGLVRVAANEFSHGAAVGEQLAHVGVEAAMDIIAPSEAKDAVGLYDLALVRKRLWFEQSDNRASYITKAEAHSGAMVAIMAPPEVGAALSQAGLLTASGAEPDNLHVTLLYLGKADELDAEQRVKIHEQVTKVCRDHRPLRMQLTGLGQFAPGNDGTPVYAVASAVGLSQLQADLERAVGQVAPLPSEHGWVPHLTLGYQAFSGSLPSMPDEPLPEWTAESVRIQMAGDLLADVALQGLQPMETADWDRAPDVPSQAVRIACSSDEKQVIYYLVSEPDSVDGHGHQIAAMDIERALHRYMAFSRQIKLEHDKPQGLAHVLDKQTVMETAVVVEGFIAPADLETFHGSTPPDGPIKQGSSILGVHYRDPAVWNLLKNIEHGISWGGYARKVNR